jgi:hypothetical protein
VLDLELHFLLWVSKLAFFIARTAGRNFLFLFLFGRA